MKHQAFEANYAQSRAYWMLDILWVVLAESANTNGQFTLLWELCPKGSGAPPHYHDQDEGFFVTEGQITYLADGELLVAKAGSFVWIPRRTVHSFRVDSETASLLNFYTPGGFEPMVMEGALPAQSFNLPPKGLGMKLNQPRLLELFDQIGMHIVNQPDELRVA